MRYNAQQIITWYNFISIVIEHMQRIHDRALPEHTRTRAQCTKIFIQLLNARASCVTIMTCATLTVLWHWPRRISFCVLCVDQLPTCDEAQSNKCKFHMFYITEMGCLIFTYRISYFLVASVEHKYMLVISIAINTHRRSDSPKCIHILIYVKRINIICIVICIFLWMCVLVCA